MRKRVLTALTLLACATTLAWGDSQGRVGHPERSVTMDALPGFINPPKGYGEVPFYWWIGDTLTREHLTDHLDQLAVKGVSSLQINYCHSDKGGKLWGLTYKSKPDIFTDEWWKLFGWFMGEAKKRNMTVSLSDYTLGVGQEKFVDEMISEYPEIKGAELHVEKKDATGGKLTWKLSHIPMSIVAYRINADNTLDESSRIDLSASVKNNTLNWNTPKGNWRVVSVYELKKELSMDPMNPVSGREYVKHFFQKFEDNFPEESKGGLNFFFSDELNFLLSGYMWNDIFKSEFIKRKGYDIVPHLASLFETTGPSAVKYRYDYNDVMVSLSEENFFKPVYDWHEQRGLIYGCDHGGRGKDVAEFGDYFRTQRWNQGAGCDQPGLGKDIIKNKVASSLAHMYGRPRTWLEGFYSSGWNTSSGMLTDALFTNFAQGQNLLSLHGLYYTTLGGWWEWAPPCNHFHEPYWVEMPELLGCMERLSYLLSQGHHVVDIAMLYPVESVVAGDGKDAVNCAFSLGESLYRQGLDFDFMDYESLCRANIKDGKLNNEGENYSILIIPAMKTMRQETLDKALAFQKAGGTVIFVNRTPSVTDKGETNLTKDKSTLPIAQNDVLEYIKDKIVPDFKCPTANPNIMHRKIGKREVYAVYNVPKGTECFFRSKGSIELWDPWTGTTKPLTAIKTDEYGTSLVMPLDKEEMQLIVFNPDGEANIAAAEKKAESVICNLDGEWVVEPLPCLDNKWGDFHWPATNAKIQPEIRSVRFSETAEKGWDKAQFDDSKWSKSTVGFGSHFLCSGALPNELDMETLLSDKQYEQWKPYDFSWRYGVEGDCGHQGYHGLKGEMYDDVIRLGKIKQEHTGNVRVDDPAGKNYYLFTNVIAPEDGSYEILAGDVKPAKMMLNGKDVNPNQQNVYLKKGANELLLHYTGACTTYMLFRDPAKAGKMVMECLAERPISTNWNGDLSLLPMDISKTANKCYYRFKGAPGLKELNFTAFGDKLKMWINGKPVKCNLLSKREDGANTYQIVLPNVLKEENLIAMEMQLTNKNQKGAAAFSSYISQNCGQGLAKLGDWAQYEGLKYYSGGMWYSKSFEVADIDSNASYELDLGDVVSSARVWINGNEVGLRMSAPWTFDVSRYIKSGNNEVKIKVFNTSYNQYLTIPTRYNSKQNSGIMGPVKIKKYE